MMKTSTEPEIDDYQFPLPGFRFHPTDEELVGFYLRRKVEKRAIGIELIKPIDIYKHNPWDLPNGSNKLGDNEWYFFCKRARKYKNSIRPNRVTGSGFWKATGIDKPIYSHGGQGNRCIGLKKTLVYYKGNAGRATKTEWMMHEFRLSSHTNHNCNSFFARIRNNNVQEAEIWTLCRIFKRSVSSTKYAPNWREIAAAKGNTIFGEMNCNPYSKSAEEYDRESNLISFSSSLISFDPEKKTEVMSNEWNPLMVNFSTEVAAPSCSANELSAPSSFDGDATDFFGYKNRETLKSMAEFGVDPCSL